MGRAALDNLPFEPLYMILGYLGADCSRALSPEPPDNYLNYDGRQVSDQPSWHSQSLQPLLTLCLVSRKLRDKVQPLLYHRFTPGYGDSWRSDCYTWNSRLTSFMRTVALRQDLATLVKRIYIHPYLLESCNAEQETWARYYTKPSESRGRQTKTDQSYPRLRLSIAEHEAQNALQEIGFALELESIKQLSPRDLVTVLIAELPNLEHCSLRLGPYYQKEEIATSAGLCKAGILHLPLKTLDISLRPLHDNPGNACCNWLFTFEQSIGALLSVCTRLETLNIHRAECSSTEYCFPPLPCLTSIRFTRGRMGEFALESLLSSCTGLRKFHYEAAEYHWPYNINEDKQFMLSNAVKYLSRHSKTLEYLHLDLRRHDYDVRDEYPKSITTFQHFTSLKHLLLNLEQFQLRLWAEYPPRARKADPRLTLLPSNIESLHLPGQLGAELPRLEKSLVGLADAMARGKFPKLREILLDQHSRLNNHLQVLALFEAVGVHFGYSSQWELGESIYVQIRQLTEPCLEPETWSLPEPEDISDL